VGRALKEADYDNELARFRYDATLHVGDAAELRCLDPAGSQQSGGALYGSGRDHKHLAALWIGSG
jgi:hypothetical protein